MDNLKKSSRIISVKKFHIRSKKDRILVAVLALAMLLVICFCVARCTSERKDYSDFLDALGARESSDRYQAENRFGYLGRYQMGELALRDAGFIDQNGIWTDLANSYGIFSDSDFLNSPAGQDAAVTAYHTKLCRYIINYGLDQYIGTPYCGIKITESGLLAACHLVGARNMKEALATGEMVYDANNVPASEYMELFSEFDISAVYS